MELTPGAVEILIDLFGTPAILLILGWKAWNGTSRRLNDMHARLIKIETILEERNKEKEPV